MYSLAAYFLGKLIPAIPQFIIHPSIFGSITYWSVGLKDEDDSLFFRFILTNFLIVVTGSFIGIFVGTCFKEIQTAAIAVVFLVLPLGLFSGFIGNRGGYPKWIGWLEYISPFKYAFEGKKIVYPRTNEINFLLIH